MDSIKLYKTINSDGGYELLWVDSGNKGQKWLRNYIEIKSNVPFKVKFLLFTGIVKKKFFLNFVVIFKIMFLV